MVTLFEYRFEARNIYGTNQHPGNLERRRVWNPPIQIYIPGCFTNQSPQIPYKQYLFMPFYIQWNRLRMFIDG